MSSGDPTAPTTTTTSLTITAVLSHPQSPPSLGRLHLHPNRVAFKPSKKDVLDLFLLEEISRLGWSEMGNRASLTILLKKNKEEEAAAAVEVDVDEDEQPVTGEPRMFRFSNLNKGDEASIRGFVKEEWKMNLERDEWDTHGLNFGKIELSREGRMLGLKSGVEQGKMVVEFPLVGVTQVAGDGKGELEIQYAATMTTAGRGLASEDDATGRFELVVARLAIPPDEDGNDVSDLCIARVNAIASVSDLEGENLLCHLPEDVGNFVIPRGKFQIEMYKDMCRLHGKGKDYRFKFSTITQLFLLDHPDQDQKYVVIMLDAPVRQGNQRYHHLVMLVDKREGEINLRLSDEEIQTVFKDRDIASQFKSEMTGSMADLVAKVFKLFSDRKVLVSGDAFKSSSSQSGVRCSVKTSPGYVYPMKRQLVFLPNKTLLLVKYDSIESMSFQRSSGSAKTWDLIVTVKPTPMEPSGATHAFQMISREEYSPLLKYFNDIKDIDIVDRKRLLSDLARGDANGPGGRRGAGPRGGTIMDLGSDDEDDDEDAEDSDFKEGGEASEGEGVEDGDDSSGSSGSSDSDDSGDDSDMAELVPMDEDEVGEDEEGEVDAPKSKRRVKNTESNAETTTKRPSKKRKRDPSAPKNARNAYAYFLEHKAEELKREKPGMEFGAMSAAVSEAWRALKDKSQWETLAAKDKQRFAEEMASYEPSPGFDKSGFSTSEQTGTTTGGNKKRKVTKKDPNAPKKPRNAFMYFTESKRPELKGMSLGEQGKRMGEMWKTLSEEDKREFVEKAERDKVRYEEEMKSYVPPPSSSEQKTSKTKKTLQKNEGGGKRTKSGKGAVSAAAGLGTSSSGSSSDDDDEDPQ